MFELFLIAIILSLLGGTEDTPDATPAVVERAVTLCAPNGGWSRINTYGIPFTKTITSATVRCSNGASIEWQIK